MSSPRYPAPGSAATRDAADPRVVGLPETTVAQLHLAARSIRDGDAATAQATLSRVIADTREHPEALRLFGLLQLRQRRAAEAVATLRRALAQWPDDALLRSDLASALAASGDLDGALASWRRATELDPDAAMPWFNLGRQLQLRGDSVAAADALMRATTRMPDFLPARVLLGDALVHLGRFDEATASYRDALAVMPACGDAWRGLANIKTRALDDTDRAQMRALLDAAHTADSDRIAIGFALGKAEEDAGHYNEAVSALTLANTLQRRLAPWREAALRDYVDQVLAATIKLPKPPNPDFGREAIFIVGLPRSGSTLLEQMLSAHPQVEGASELPDLGEVLVAELNRRGQPWPHWIGQATAQDWLRLGRDYLKRTARWRQHRPRHTDKMPENWKFAGVLRAMLPGAHIIDMRRDPLETAWSCYKQQFYQLPHFGCDFADIAAYLHHCERALDVWRERDPQHLHVQHYEALVAHPEVELRRLLAALGLEFAPSCLDYARSSRSVRTASAAQVREPLRADTARAPRYGALLDPLRAELARWPLRRNA
ncbi:MAG TPA: sulfotransferase [Patescibacteria group bacterium]|nr:sulfotransferase [Patescibacteria group bacterium]